jgi:hypothetical protein
MDGDLGRPLGHAETAGGVGLKRFAFLANSDFHKPKHIYSWKTLLQCEKDPEAIKECIRRNEHVSLTLYREGMSGEALRAQPRAEEVLPPEAVSLRLALPAAVSWRWDQQRLEAP